MTGETKPCLCCGIEIHAATITARFKRQKYCSRSCASKSKPEKPLVHRFYSRIVRSDNPDDCWIWVGKIAKKRGSYGAISVAGNKTRLAHRVSWEIANGASVPVSLMVLHSCDNPRCVNPNHLSLGTALDNSNDARARGRTACGERAFGAKLTGDSVKFIRWLLSEGAVRADVARQYKTTPGNISLIRDRINWRHVP